MSNSIAHYFETSSHSREANSFLRSRIIPLKFAYAGSSSFTHGRLADSTGYKQVNWQLRGEVAAAAELDLRETKAVVEFGPGDGSHSFEFLSALDFAATVEHYVAVDFSRTLFHAAISRIIRSIPSARVEFFPTDLEQSFAEGIALPLADKTLFLVLGGLFANVENPQMVARHIQASLPPDVKGIISVPGNSTDDPHRQLLPYRSDVFAAAAMEPAKTLGIPADIMDFRLHWDDAEDAVVGMIVLRKRWAADGDPQFSLEAGDEIRCFQSRRFDAPKLEALLSSAGFTMVAAPSIAHGGALIATVRS